MKKSLFLATICMFFFQCKDQSPNAQKVIHIKIAEFDKIKVDKKDLVVLDVRTPEEISNGKIDENAFELNFHDDNFKQMLQKLDKSKPHVIYCRSGGRSAKAAKIMVGLGFKEVYNLQGGYSEWESQ